MFRKLFLSLAAIFLLTPTLLAYDEVVTITPSNPVEGQTVRVSISAVWPNGCVPREARVQRSGQTISVVFVAAYGIDVGCATVLVPYQLSASLGALEAGTFDLIVQTYVEIPLVNPPPPATTVLRRELVVAEASQSLVLTPASGSIHGGTEVLIRRANGQPLSSCTARECQPVEVRFGGQLAESGVHFPGHVIVRVPAHAAGAVDVTVVGPGGTFSARNGFRYFDPAAPLDPSTHATVLFPLYFNGRGAYGSQWETLIDIRNRNEVRVDPLQPVMASIASQTTGTLDPGTGVRERGVLLHVPRDLLSGLSFAAFVRDSSRDAERWGTELPVVREEDFATEIEFPRVPLDKRYRVTLRLYTLGQTNQPILAELYEGDVRRGQATLHPTKRTEIEPGFAIVENLRDLIPSDAGDTIRLHLRTTFRTTPFWALLTVTNNETQHVTVIRPQ